MKKHFVQWLATACVLLSTTAVMAAPHYQVTVEPISDALSSHAALLSKKMAGIAVDIIVVNYTNSSIIQAYPGVPRLLSERTSGRIQSAEFLPFTTVILQNAQGVEFWRSNTVGPFDTISVYLSNDRYVVYDTH